MELFLWASGFFFFNYYYYYFTFFPFPLSGTPLLETKGNTFAKLSDKLKIWYGVLERKLCFLLYIRLSRGELTYSRIFSVGYFHATSLCGKYTVVPIAELMDTA